MEVEVDHSLREETERLVRAWGSHSADQLRDGLVWGLQDPRLSLQRILVRHYFIRQLWPRQLEDLMRDELRHAVRAHVGDSGSTAARRSLDTVRERWRDLLQDRPSRPVTVLEVPCGSANDYRYFDSYGLAGHLAYTGVDLCRTNIVNARAMFPNVAFEHGNAFALDSFGRHDYVFVADLFEHLSFRGIEAAVTQVVAAATKGVVVNFFEMSPVLRHHVYRPIPERHYFWHTLSLSVMKRLFTMRGMRVNAIVLSDYLDPIGNFAHYDHRVTFIATRETVAVG
jgi:SAM-dependent methyltransferase